MGMSTDLAKPALADHRQRLADFATEALALCRARGASQAEVSINEDSGLSVNVRLGEVETVERSGDRGVAVSVYFGQRKGTASTADLQPASLEATVDQAWLVLYLASDAARFCTGQIWRANGGSTHGR